MKPRILNGTGLVLAALLCLVPARAQESQPWIHVRVTDNDEGGKKVSVNLPLSLAKVALEVAPRDVMEKGRLKLKEKDISVADLRRLWTELKASGDAEFVTVEEKDKTVRVTRAGNYLRVDVKNQSEKNETVQVRMPIVVVDALLSGEGETMDIGAAIAQLNGQSGEIVTVDGSDSQVRIWIDENRS
jgi:hypothetical protein